MPKNVMMDRPLHLRTVFPRPAAMAVRSAFGGSLDPALEVYVHPTLGKYSWRMVEIKFRPH